MRKYKIVSILWNDHLHVSRSKMIDDPVESMNPTLSVGILYKSTKQAYVLVSDIERYQDRDDATYTIILKPVIQMQEYGEIELVTLRE